MPSIEYWAGFFDGEGSISISQRLTVQVVVAQNNRPILELLKDEFAGAIYRKNSKFIKGLNWKVFKVEDVLRFLKAIEPYVLVKKKDVELGLKVARLMRKENKGCNPLSYQDIAERSKARDELLALRPKSRRNIKVMESEANYRQQIKEKYAYKCCGCGMDLKTASPFYVIISDDKLWCRKCNFRRYDRTIKPVSKERIIEVLKTTKSLDDAAKKLGIVRSSLLEKRRKFGLSMRRVAKKIKI